jgi:hypothetical protein
LPRALRGASAMSAMTAFFGSSGLTSPCATPTIFSYCPTSGHEKPPKVGDSLCVTLTSMRVMRACASGTVRAVIATAAAAAMCKRSGDGNARAARGRAGM